ncbi:hypothetical protein [Cytobacillus purgationiresistens]|uniref:Membrane protein YdbS with pleckstrin-like domain n=1 Tax=Cytobacillus purgationiresistens TaxID=863449 RepID=A0ABU0AEW6_9BACI|nr:hypothetical protein [Cytobacillus purgationiresistens]MDQ0269801.1 membrane protein YdbS with pleckstrin-like domain [Cytobacillus purgationiresistens]
MNSTFTVFLPIIIYFIIFVFMSLFIIRYAKSKVAMTAVIVVGIIILLFIILGVYPLIF